MTRFAQVFFVTFIVLSGPARAAENMRAEKTHYKDCMVLAHSQPEEALKSAKVWLHVGGGFAARHCGLAALMNIGLFVEAAQGFERLGNEVQGDNAVKTSLFIQSANAWIAANKPERARQNADAALKIEPGNNQALFNRAKASIMAKNPWDGADDLTRILYKNPKAIDVLLLRGSAYAQMKAKDLARTDFQAALRLDPENTEIQSYIDNLNEN